MCEHTYKIVDHTEGNDVYKVGLCTKCNHIGKIQRRNEPPKVKSQDEIWAEKDRRMARMSAIKSAVEMGGTTEEVLETANKYLEWIYLP